MRYRLALTLASIWLWSGPAPAGDHVSPIALAISQDEQGVYDAVLSSWLGKEQGPQLVNLKLSPPPALADPEMRACTEGVRFPPRTPEERGAKSLVGAHFKKSGIELIDGSKWKAADPGVGIARGQSVESAVRDGFSHSLISFSQVAFSADRKHALVEFRVVCGRLCGSGSTLHLHKSWSGWAVLNRCGEWIS